MAIVRASRIVSAPAHFILALHVVVTVLGCLTRHASAWWDAGHMLTVSIAKYRVEKEVAKKAERLIEASIFAQEIADVPSLNLVSAAHWADNVKLLKAMVLSPSKSYVDYASNRYMQMHFWNLPLDGPDGFKCTMEPPTGDFNVVTALSAMEKIITDRSVPEWSRGVALRFYIHFAGDIHQPLHVATRCSESLPAGDAGGNQFLLKGEYGNLHKVWDAAGGKFRDLEALCPFTDPATCSKNEVHRVTAVNAAAQRLIKQNEGTLASVHTEALGSYMDWAMDSKLLAEAYAYVNITEGTTPSAEYLHTVQTISTEQIVKGGERLALCLTNLLGNKNETTFFEVVTIVAIAGSALSAITCFAVSIYTTFAARGKARRAMLSEYTELP